MQQGPDRLSQPAFGRRRLSSRNTTLFIAALRLGRLVAAGVLDESAVGAALADACAVHIGRDGFTAGEAARAIRNGLQYARRRRTPG